MKIIARVGTLCLMTLMLHACTTTQPSAPSGSSGNKGRYQIDQDIGPDSPVDTSTVPDAVPRKEARTIAGNKNPYTVLGKTYHLIEDESSYRERGKASWYGRKFHGHHTSNGEIYDMYAMTAAHKTLPIPSYVRVTNVANGKTVVVRINDRGPFHSDRIIDLSYAAAQRIGILGTGTGLVDVEIALPDDAPPAPLKNTKPLNQIATDSALPAGTHLQIGAFSSEAGAKQFAAQVAAKLSYPVIIRKADVAGTIYRVRVGPLSNAQQLQSARRELEQLNILQSHVVYE